MACVVTTTPKNNGTILDILKRIDRMQKDAVNQDLAGNCNTCIFSPVYNTKPISVYTCNGLLTVNTTATDATTANVFRVEAVNDETVVLRLITVAGEELTCTNNTITIKVSCICGIQCFDSITCTLCNQTGA